MGQIILYSFFSGITVFLGGLFSKYFERFPKIAHRDNIIHTSIAFGGGILIAAVALVLVPKGIEILPLSWIIILFLLGSIAFLFLDKTIAKKGGSIAQFLAMLMDFIPEAISLGAIFGYNPRLGLLLATFIGLQNFPESFNAYLDLRKSGNTSKKSLLILFALSFIGVISAVIGHLFLRDKPYLTSSLMIFASGGILYLIFQDIAPMSKINSKWFPATGATMGFLVGIIGEKLLG